MERLNLGTDGAAVVRDLVNRLVATHKPLVTEPVLREAATLAHRLPARLRRKLLDFRLEEKSSAFLISGLIVEEEAIGPTPNHWKDGEGRQFPFDLLLILCGSLLGDAFAWASQQEGAFIHNVLPMREYETTQLGFSSTETLWWHTEDAFHPQRPDYLGLLCLRNNEEAETTFAEVAQLDLSSEIFDILFEQRVIIRPDYSHLPNNNPHDENSTCQGAYTAIIAMQKASEKVAALFGSRQAPYLRLDPFFMEVPEGNIEARRALDALCTHIDERLRSVVLKPGDLLFLDNHRCVHGRKPFEAHYDGTGRWLKRINLARDLRSTQVEGAISRGRIR